MSDPNYRQAKLKWDTKRALAARDKTLAIAFLKRVRESKYGALVTDLENQYTRGTDQYPNDLTAAYNMLLNYRPQNERGYNRRRTPRNPETETHDEENVQTEMSFLQSNAPIPGTDGILHEYTKSYACQRKWNYSGKCPDESVVEV